MTDSTPENEKRNLTVSELLSSLSEHSTKAVKEALLDEEFLRVFAQRLLKVMNNEPIIDHGTLNLEVTEEPVSSKSFLILFTPDSEDTGVEVYRNNEERAEIPHDLSVRIRDTILEKFTVTEPQTFWVTLTKKGENHDE